MIELYTIRSPTERHRYGEARSTSCSTLSLREKATKVQGVHLVVCTSIVRAFSSVSVICCRTTAQREDRAHHSKHLSNDSCSRSLQASSAHKQPRLVPCPATRSGAKCTDGTHQNTVSRLISSTRHSCALEAERESIHTRTFTPRKVLLQKRIYHTQFTPEIYE